MEITALIQILTSAIQEQIAIRELSTLQETNVNYRQTFPVNRQVLPFREKSARLRRHVLQVGTLTLLTTTVRQMLNISVLLDTVTVQVMKSVTEVLTVVAVL